MDNLGGEIRKIVEHLRDDHAGAEIIKNISHNAARVSNAGLSRANASRAPLTVARRALPGEQVKAPNKPIEDFIKKDSKLAFINIFPAMLGEDGMPKPDIFLKDNPHMNANGYAIWTPIMRPYLKE